MNTPRLNCGSFAFLLHVLALALAAVAIVTLRAAPLANYASHQLTVDRTALTFVDTAGNQLRLRSYGTHMVRVQATRPGQTFFNDDRYLMVERHNHGGTLTVVSETAAALTLRSGAVRVSVNKAPLRLSFAEDATGRVLLSDAGGIDLDTTTLRYVFTPDPAEQFVGYGQKRLSLQDTLFLTGRTERRNYNEEGYPGRGAQGVLCVPFYLSSKGYGFFANSTFPSEARFAVGGTDYSFRLTVGGYASQADYFFILGPALTDVVERYTQLTGRPRLLPKAIYGLHLSDNDPRLPDDKPVDQNWWQTMVTNHRNAGFPLDLMVFDNDWRAASPLIGGQIGQWGGSQFAWEPTRYPDPTTFRNWFGPLGLLLSLDLNLNNCNDSSGWLPSYNIRPTTTNTAVGDRSEPDYSNPAVRSWLWLLFWYESFDPALGYPGDAIWLDESDGIGVPDNTVLHNGRPWLEMKNYYFFLNAYAATAEGWDNVEGGITPGIGESRRPHVWIRGGTPGMQRYATHWTGDIDFTHPFYHGHIIGLQASGLAAFPFFNHDAGGFGANSSSPDPLAKIEGPNDDFYIQWGMAFGSFTPIWRPHGYGQPRWPLNRNTACQDAFRRYATLRYEMMPYIYSLAHQSHARGLPMARAMCLVHPDRAEAWQAPQQYQYYWGDSLLVAPVLDLFVANQADQARTAWLPPAAKWYDFWDDTPVALGTNGGFHTFTARYGYLPVFVKAGAIIPRQNFALNTASLSDTHLTLDVYVGADGIYSLVEDDGRSERFRTRAELRTTPISYTHTTRQLQVSPATGTYLGASAARSYLARFHGLVAAPLSVTADGATVAVAAGPLSAGSTLAAAWDAGSSLLSVRLPSRSVSMSAAITYVPGSPPTSSSSSSGSSSSSSGSSSGGGGGGGGAPTLCYFALIGFVALARAVCKPSRRGRT